MRIYYFYTYKYGAPVNYTIPSKAIADEILSELGDLMITETELGDGSKDAVFNSISDGTATITGGAISGATNTNWDIAYSHSQDNTQAHSDYLINNGNDSTSGSLTTVGLNVTGTFNLKYDTSNYVAFAVDADGDLSIDSTKASYTLGFTDANVIGVTSLEFKTDYGGAKSYISMPDVYIGNWFEISGSGTSIDGTTILLPTSEAAGIYIGYGRGYNSKIQLGSVEDGAYVTGYGLFYSYEYGFYSETGDLTLKYGNLTDGVNSLTIANAKTAYDHSIDNTQAHTDYLINNGDNTTTGALTVGGTADTEQLIVKANASQTNAHPLLRFQNSAGGTILDLHSDHVSNVFLGNSAGSANVVSGADGISNIFIGDDAGSANISGSYNVAVGENALQANRTGDNNFALGGGALYTLDGGSSNVAIGTSTLYDCVSGIGNVAIGQTALTNATASYNVAIGEGALFSLTSGGESVAIGRRAGVSITTGVDNTMIGYRAGESLGTSDSGSVMIGHEAGYYETASNKLFIDNDKRTDEADGRVKALIYGIFDAATANQVLTINAATINMPFLPVADPGVAGQLWNNGGALTISAG